MHHARLEYVAEGESSSITAHGSFIVFPFPKSVFCLLLALPNRQECLNAYLVSGHSIMRQFLLHHQFNLCVTQPLTLSIGESPRTHVSHRRLALLL